MSAYIAFFSAFALIVILYSLFYKEYVFMPRLKRLNLANEYRYAKKLNAELMEQLVSHEAQLKKSGNVFSGMGYDTVMLKLQTQHNEIYSNDITTLLKKSKHTVDNLLLDISGQIKMLHEVKTNCNKTLQYRNNFAA